MFFGWRMVALAFLTNFISVGFVFYSYGVFFKALAHDFGGSRLGVAFGLSTVQVMTAFCAPFVGRVLDRGQSRKVMGFGAVLLAIGFVAGSRIEALWQFYVVFGVLMGSGVCMLGGLASSTLVANWFVGRRGVALGFAAMGISVSGVLMPPVSTALIAELGWRTTFLVYAAIALFIVAPPVALFVVHRPEDIGQGPDGEPPHVLPSGLPGPTTAAAANGSVLRERNFWVIAAVIALNFGAMGAVLTHAVPHATDLGFSPAAAAFVLSVMAGGGAIGKPAFGWVADRIDKRYAMGAAALLQLIGVELLLHARGYEALIVAGACFGLGMGGIVPLQGALVGAAFGRDAFGRVMGLLSPAMMPISTLGNPFAGYVFDRTGGYDLAFGTFVGVYALSIAVLMFLRLPRIEPGRAAVDRASARA